VRQRGTFPAHRRAVRGGYLTSFNSIGTGTHGDLHLVVDLALPDDQMIERRTIMDTQVRVSWSEGAGSAVLQPRSIAGFVR
jgi:hypothetical protein